MKLITHLQLVLRLRMHGVPSYVFMVQYLAKHRENFHLYLPLLTFIYRGNEKYNKNLRFSLP